MTAVMEPAAATLDGVAVRRACNRVKFAADKPGVVARFGNAGGVWAIRDGEDTLFLASDGVTLALERVPGRLALERAFFPLEALIGSGKRATRGMPEAAEPCVNLWPDVVALALEAESGRGPTLWLEAADVDQFARMVRSAGTPFARLDVDAGELRARGWETGAVEFDISAPISGAVDAAEWSTTWIDPRRLADAVRKLDGDARVSIARIGRADARIPFVAVRQAAFTVAVAGRVAESKTTAAEAAAAARVDQEEADAADAWAIAHGLPPVNAGRKAGARR